MHTPQDAPSFPDKNQKKKIQPVYNNKTNVNDRNRELLEMFDRFDKDKVGYLIKEDMLAPMMDEVADEVF